MRNHTFRSISESMGRDKRTVQAWYQRAKDEHGELGELISGTRFFDDGERKKLIAYAGEKPLRATNPAPRFTVEMGNHAAEKTLQVGATSTSLEQFRTDRIRQQLANPKEFMTNLNGFLDQIETGIDAAEKAQEAELLQTREIKQTAQKRLGQFRRRVDEYRIKSDLMALLQNADLEEVEDIAAELNTLGKPAVEPSPQS
ncbi:MULTISPECIES: hypothetical protein [unclassified Leptolyngbya]|uniref:hypothetical protein n=1 Tax=unclassified Leptolyngbya TaxID=2650499 RepID=UPI0016899E57|nr:MULTISPECIES: hypothetical protein [unclassified Leptolyngbya]MBD1913615.1 hypothetical protein [Leptolyngbya sp. FACHB-8]MBD2154054.1 hypothetical protein [Leptolyngbya sp. FACHB-16]